ncbi:DUF6153 family protein [Kribbella sp. DT2]|uniref:DUF6153 family protein n=1 Tax=Kribbella sp. DT2 TaxID=3393427 RepID=UPI003CF9DB1D
MDSSRRTGWSNLAWTSCSKSVRSLVILGALLGVFALHSLSPLDDQAPAISDTVAGPVAHEAIEGLEQLATVSPSVLAQDSVGHQHLLLPCLALLASSVLLLTFWLALRRRRFGDVARLPEPTSSIPRLRRPVRRAPVLAKLCVLRT